MNGIQINCDVGEAVGNETDLMPYIQQCNIACGGHAGDEDSMREMVELAKKHEVSIGAHPSYPDPVNFGRISMKLDSEELIKTIRNQLKSLDTIVVSCNAKLSHIKAHGALYNDTAKNINIAQIFLEAIAHYKFNIKLFVPFNSVIAKLAKDQGYIIEYEAFADRNYNDDLTLVSRVKENAILTDIPSIIEHVRMMKVLNSVRTVNGRIVNMKATTFCVHSDTSNASTIVKELRISDLF